LYIVVSSAIINSALFIKIKSQEQQYYQLKPKYPGVRDSQPCNGMHLGIMKLTVILHCQPTWWIDLVHILFVSIAKSYFSPISKLLNMFKKYSN